MEDLVAHAISRLLWAQRLADTTPKVEMGFAETQSRRLPEAEFEWPVFKQVIKHARLFIIEAKWLIEIYGNVKDAGVAPISTQPKVEPPTILPFECVFLTTEDAVSFSDVGQYERELVGFVLSLRGQFRAWVVLRNTEGDPVFLALHTSGRWQGPTNLSSLVVPQLAAAINQQPAVVEPLSFAQRRHWQKQGKLVSYPEPFYRVHRPATACLPQDASAPLSAQARQAPAFRFDSRAHLRLLCFRGQLPIADTDRATLVKRGYHVFLGSEVPPGWTEAMLLRGHKPPMPDEWIAVRHVPVKQSIKGDANLPYTPSLRTLR